MATSKLQPHLLKQLLKIQNKFIYFSIFSNITKITHFEGKIGDVKRTQ